LLSSCFDDVGNNSSPKEKSLYDGKEAGKDKEYHIQQKYWGRSFCICNSNAQK